MERKPRRRFAGFDLDKRGAGPTDIGSSLSLWLAKHGREACKRDQLCGLWRNWRTAMGDGLAERARPLGSRNSVLLIGGDDQFVLQELVFETSEILERANAFLKEERFRKVELHLLMGRTDLRRVDTTQLPERPGPVRPEGLGTLVLPPDSPVAAAYDAYVRLFDGKGESSRQSSRDATEGGCSAQSVRRPGP